MFNLHQQHKAARTSCGALALPWEPCSKEGCPRVPHLLSILQQPVLRIHQTERLHNSEQLQHLSFFLQKYLRTPYVLCSCIVSHHLVVN